jgi:hypothetical protein
VLFRSASLISIDEYFRTLQTANETRNHVSLGVALINGTLGQKYHPILSACLVNRFASCDALIIHFFIEFGNR